VRTSPRAMERLQQSGADNNSGGEKPETSGK
jgi:hypothetical protein